MVSYILNCHALLQDAYNEKGVAVWHTASFYLTPIILF